MLIFFICFINRHFFRSSICLQHGFNKRVKLTKIVRPFIQPNCLNCITFQYMCEISVCQSSYAALVTLDFILKLRLNVCLLRYGQLCYRFGKLGFDSQLAYICP